MTLSTNYRANFYLLAMFKGDVTREDSEGQFLAEHRVATLFRIVTTLFQHCNAVLR